eukprot:m.59320 g.59320  ORF g.59320 m.59320 type:complete len:72 (-) comp17324_c0_seq4:894-1109(-)
MHSTPQIQAHMHPKFLQTRRWVITSAHTSTHHRALFITQWTVSFSSQCVLLAAQWGSLVMSSLERHEMADQ